MDDDRKVGASGDDAPSGAADAKKPNPAETTQLVEMSKMVFLREIINEFQRKQQQYDLGSEFSKTKRNRSVIVPAVILGLVVVFTGVVIGVTRYIQAQSRAIQVDIQDFADVNLRDILDEAQRLQNQLDVVRRELATVIATRDQQISQVERQRDRDVGLLADQALSAAQRTQREADFRAVADQRIAAINEEFQPQVEELEARIAELEAAIAQYDSRQLDQAREQEQVLNNQQRVFELQIEEVRTTYETEIERLTGNYENEIERLENFQQEFERTIRQRHANELAALRAQHAAEVASLTSRYNPNLEDEPVGALLDAGETPLARSFSRPAPYQPTLGSEGAISAADYRNLVAGYQEFADILARMREVPYINSVPDALEQLDQRSRDLIAQYQSIWQTLGASVVDRNATIATQSQEIEQFLFALGEYANFNGDIGYILDPRDPQAIVVYINNVRSVDVGALGYVFRRDDEFVGTIRFVREGERMIARVVDGIAGMELQAFDRVLIEVE